MDPVQRARYDAAVQRYHDNAAIQRERFESAMKDARRQLTELAERTKGRRTRGTTTAKGGELLARGFTVGHGGTGRPEHETTPVQAILNRG